MHSQSHHQKEAKVSDMESMQVYNPGDLPLKETIDENSNILKLNVALLMQGKTNEMNASISNEFLDFQGDDLQFTSSVDLKGEAYVVDDRLVLHFDVMTHVNIPCVVCNGSADIEVRLHNFYHVEDIKNIKLPYFDFQNLLKEEIMLEVPQFGECNNGKCPERQAIDHFFKKNDNPNSLSK